MEKGKIDMTAPDDQTVLPELPEPARRAGQQMCYDGWDKAFFDCFDPSQMRAYGEACANAAAAKERTRCARASKEALLHLSVEERTSGDIAVHAVQQAISSSNSSNNCLIGSPPESPDNCLLTDRKPPKKRLTAQQRSALIERHVRGGALSGDEYRAIDAFICEVESAIRRTTQDTPT